MKKNLVNNEKIPFNEFLLIDVDGSSLGIVSKSHALSLAEEKDLDIYLVVGTSKPAVVKFGHISKILYEQEKKIQKQKQKIKIVLLKTLTLSIRINFHDLKIKLQKGKAFLISGNKLAISIKLRKKELTDENLINAKSIFEKNIIPELIEYATIEKPVSVSGLFIKMIFSPIKNKHIEKSEKH